MRAGERTRDEQQASLGPPVRSTPVPPLRTGDRLTRPEFERRFDAMPELKKAELIDGVVYIPSPDFYSPGGDTPEMPSPVSFKRHATSHFDLIGWMYQYRAETPGVRGGDNGSLRLDLDNMPQPDAFLLILPEFGGRARISADDYVEGGPELVAEVAYSSVNIDLHAKFHVYRRNGVQEYIVWRTEDEAIDLFVNRDGQFVAPPPGPDGIYRSAVFPGLWLDPMALLRGDAAAVLRVVRAGLATPEHAVFVARLAETSARLGGPAGPPGLPRGDRP